MKIQLLLFKLSPAFIIIFFLASCATPSQKKQDTTSQEKKDSVITALSPVCYRSFWGKDTIDNYLISFFKNDPELELTQEYGGGDAFGAFTKYSLAKTNETVVLDSLVCGDYGYSYAQFYLKAGRITSVREVFQSNDLDYYALNEFIFYLSTNNATVKERKAESKNLVESLENIPFEIKELPFDSISAKLNDDYKSLLKSKMQD